MIEVVVTKTGDLGGQTGSRMVGLLRFNEDDASAAPEQPQPLDGRTLAVVMGGLRKIAAEQAKAWEEFGNPATSGGNGGSG